jgi:hypothetical protein
MTEDMNKDLMDTSESYCYTYEVTMIVQVLASNKEIADAKLNQDGGYVSKRTVKVLDSVLVYKEEEEKEEKVKK